MSRSAADAAQQPVVFADPALDRRFRKSGLAVVDLLDGPGLATLRSALEALGRVPGTGFLASLYHPDPAYRVTVDAVVRKHLGPPLAAVVPEHRIAFSNLVVKSAEAPQGAVPLHLDWSFVEEPAHASLGFWCPLTDVAPENGCLELVPGSHRLGHARRGACTPFPYPALEPLLRTEFLRPVPLRAGQALVFHHGIIHGSPPNTQDTERVAVAGVLVPRAAGLRYHHVPDPQRPEVLEVFAVDDAFYLYHEPGTRPATARLVGRVTAPVPALDATAVAATLAAAVRRRATIRHLRPAVASTARGGKSRS